MTITVVCDILGQENNGTTIATMNLIRFLESRGHIVRILCADPNREIDDKMFVTPTHDFGKLINDYVAKNGVSLAKADKNIIAKAIDGVDIVHIMFPFSLGQATAKIAQKNKIPLSAGFHLLAENVSTHFFLTKSCLANAIIYSSFHNMYKRCDSIHYVSQFLRDEYEKRYGKTNGYVISNGVNDIFRPTHQNIDDGLIRILYTGRYSKEKSHKTLISAVKQSKYRDKILLILAGDGPIKNKLQKQAKSLPIQPIFKQFSREEMVKVINTADLYVHAAEYEAEGIGCLEALACGVVPIISNSKKSATKYYAIDEKNLYHHCNAQNLAEKIDWWIEHPKEKEEYSKRYATLSRDKFDHTACMLQMEQMLLATAKIKK